MNGRSSASCEPPPGRPDRRSGLGRTPWETPDIWLDSGKNSFGKYRYTDGAGNPVGQGDDAWLRATTGDGRTACTSASQRRTGRGQQREGASGERRPAWRPRVEVEHAGAIVFLVAGQGTAQDYLNWVTKTGKQHTCGRSSSVPSGS